MPGLWDELRRRKVVRVAIAYAAAGWFLIQVADIVLDNFEAPGWIFQTILLLLIIGFPAALILAWAFKLTPDGIRREEFEHLPKQAAPVIAIISVTLIFGSAALWLRVDGLGPAPADARLRSDGIPAVQPHRCRPAFQQHVRLGAE